MAEWFRERSNAIHKRQPTRPSTGVRSGRCRAELIYDHAAEFIYDTDSDEPDEDDEAMYDDLLNLDFGG